MQLYIGIGTQADDVAGVGRYFRLIEDTVEHELPYCFKKKNDK
jgi:hypothetical protein